MSKHAFSLDFQALWFLSKCTERKTFLSYHIHPSQSRCLIPIPCPIFTILQSFHPLPHYPASPSPKRAHRTRHVLPPRTSFVRSRGLPGTCPILIRLEPLLRYSNSAALCSLEISYAITGPFMPAPSCGPSCRKTVEGSVSTMERTSASLSTSRGIFERWEDGADADAGDAVTAVQESTRCLTWLLR